MALREVERARSPLWVSQAAAACGPLDGASSRWCFLSMVLPLHTGWTYSHHRRVRLAAGWFVSSPAGSSLHRLVRLFTGWFFSPLADSFCFSPPAGSSLHHELQLEQCPVAWARRPSLFVLCQRSSACSCSQLRMCNECYAPYISFKFICSTHCGYPLRCFLFLKLKAPGFYRGSQEPR
jgi:hypothetical protein